MAWIAASVAVGGSLLQSGTAQEDQSWKQSAKNTGQHNSQVIFQRSRAWEQLPYQARAIEQQAVVELAAIDADRAAAEASAVAQAAAAGATGVNVSQVQQNINYNGKQVANAVELKRDTAVQGLRKQAQDIFWQADANIQEFTLTGTPASGSASLLKAGFDGLTAFASAGGFSD